ncbi:hypothetical protein ACFQI7_23970 [Paenibacillus allorhizosphaerae]|uniref:DUF58 domain-containing protein n=1 Tax=Paenibacillus allorhizosphaerae TaxID=2849866 RepID=A0ABN7TQG2_9BACL|nr:hypothetical protein [Paenibacillus allorhizosphaerae]CAG7646629.1 hypothetical protein PAECIP111802_03793 [Paenibacillus allorhizosphaerae]
MSKHKGLWLSASIVLFLALIALAIVFESTQFLYAASALPIVIVLLLPDIQNQYIHSNKKKQALFTKHGEGDEAAIAITFSPGYVQWKRNKLYFRIDSVAVSDKTEAAVGADAVSLGVLPFDLCVHPRKAGWVGIDLSQIAERTRGLSFTTKEVTRLVIRMNDLETIGMHLMGTAPIAGASVPGSNTTMEA